MLLAAGTIATVTAGLVIPYTPVAGWFGFSPLPAGFLAILAAMVAVYLALVEVGKSFFFGRVRALPHLPIERFEQAPAVRAIERLASRWTVHRRPRRPSPAQSSPSR